MKAFARFALPRCGALAAILSLAACGGGDDPANSSTDSTAQHGTPNSPSSAPSQPSDDPAQESLNWAGYVRAGGLAEFTSISGSWIVPDLQCGAGNQNSSTWVGIGGGVTTDPTLIQAGTEQDCRDSEKFFSAWWEALPAPQVPAEGLILVTGNYPVAAGDAITVTITSTLVIWDITIHNATQGWTFDTTVPYLSGGDTAEWIEEAPLTAGTSGNGQLPIANFGRAQFSGVTLNGGNPMLVPAERMNLVDGSGTTFATASAPAASGDAFSVCYGAGPC